jgi:sulfate/thiosulfate transport system permease protein
MTSATISNKRRGKSPAAVDEPGWGAWVLIVVSVAFAGVFLVLPLANVLWQAFRDGLPAYFAALVERDTLAAGRLTLLVAAVVVPINTVAGLAAAWLVTKFHFRGKVLLLTLIDLPFSVSPVVAGLLLFILFGAQGFGGSWLREHGLKILFAPPGIILATTFVTFPFVARELIPAMEAQGSDQEHAALTLGASGWQTFRRVTVPSVRWGLFYGILLCTARSMGEFGAVSVVSGHITGETDTLPLRVEKLFQDVRSDGGHSPAFAVSSVLVLLALLTLLLKSWFERRHENELSQGQRAGHTAREH